VILPIGISFYTFEAISYTVDVYRRRIPAERNLLHFLLFITFFPHLVAGPIVRPRDFLPQIRRPKRWDWLRMQLGLQYLVMGLFKKIAIADRMALFADPVFADPHSYGTRAVWIAVGAYALQIYCDFSGYTDMALGAAHLLGYKLAQNFNMPYLATNVSEFWHRWHMSLSTWLRDYLFIPLGGSRGLDCSRRQRLRTNRNLMLTMALGGLWHGASWTFAGWGVLHGFFLIAHRSFRDYVIQRPRLDRLLLTLPGQGVRMALTLFCIGIGWVFFRASSFTAAGDILGRLFVRHAGMGPPLAAIGFWYTMACVGVCHYLGQSGLWRKWAPRLPAPVLGFGYAMALVLAMLLAPDSGRAFIYFQF
jgi:alginate O-acetyltransferase complex protein AlgI